MAGHQESEPCSGKDVGSTVQIPFRNDRSSLQQHQQQPSTVCSLEESCKEGVRFFLEWCPLLHSVSSLIHPKGWDGLLPLPQAGEETRHIFQSPACVYEIFYLFLILKAIQHRSYMTQLTLPSSVRKGQLTGDFEGVWNFLQVP